jgi:rhodanese-related sulfurtransferase
MFDWLKPKKPESPPEPEPPKVQEITAKQLRELLASPEPPLVLDVREAYELADGIVPGSVHIPMRFIPTRLAELPRDQPIVAYCAAGVRSYHVAGFLLAQGYGDVKSLAGGIMDWQAASR